MNIIISGDVGVGKTYLLCALYNEIVREYDVLFLNMMRLIDSVKESFKKPNHEKNSLYNKAIKIPILFIDELGAGYGTDGERVMMYNLFNSRWENKKPIIATTNCGQEDLLKRLGKRSYDRVFPSSEIIRLKITGESRR